MIVYVLAEDEEIGPEIFARARSPDFIIVSRMLLWNHSAFIWFKLLDL